MNMKQRNSYLFVILCWLCTYGFPVQAQDVSLQAIEEAINSYNYRQAIDLIGRLDSVTPDLQRKKLAAYKELNQYSDAVHLLNEMIAADSLNMHLYIERANCYLMQNSDNKALEEYGKALVLAPGNTYIRTKIGQLYFRNEQYEEAKALAETMLAGDTTQYALRLLGDCYGKTEQPDSALFIYKRALERDSSDYAAVLRLSNLYLEMDSVDAAIRYTDEYMELDSLNLPVNRVNAFAYFQKEQFRPALDKYRNLSQLGDNTANTNYYLGLCYLKNDSLPKAYECLDMANKKAKEKNPQILTYLGIAAIEMPGYATEGIEATKKAIELIMPDSTLMFSLYNTLAKGFVMRRELKEEIVTLKISLSYNPQSSVTLNHIAYAYDILKDNKNAVRYYQLFLDSISRREKLSGYMQKLKDAAEERLQYYREEEFFKGE